MASISMPAVHALPRRYLPVPTSRPPRTHLRSSGASNRSVVLASSAHDVASSSSSTLRSESCIVGDFMMKKGNFHVVKSSTTINEAMEVVVEKNVTGFPVVDEEWKLVGVVSDYDLLALDSISGGDQNEINIFPDVNSTWRNFKEIQRLLSKSHGEVIGDVMTPAPSVVSETTSLQTAARLLLETKYHRLPVVDHEGKLVGIITREDVVRAGWLADKMHS